MDFFNLDHGYNNTQLKQAYLSKVDSILKLGISELEKEILMNETDRLYQKAMDNLRGKKPDRIERSIFRPFSYFDFPLFSTNLWMNDIPSQLESIFNHKPYFSSNSIEYRERTNEDGSKSVYESRNTSKNGEINQITNSYSISKDGKKTPLTFDEAKKVFSLNEESIQRSQLN
jgi:hypothetical protein